MKTVEKVSDQVEKSTHEPKVTEKPILKRTYGAGTARPNQRFGLKKVEPVPKANKMNPNNKGYTAEKSNESEPF